MSEDLRVYWDKVYSTTVQPPWGYDEVVAAASADCQYILVTNALVDGFFMSSNGGESFNNVSMPNPIHYMAVGRTDGAYSLAEYAPTYPTTATLYIYRDVAGVMTWDELDPDPEETFYHYYPFLFVSEDGRRILIYEWNIAAVKSKLLYSDDYGTTFTDYCPIHPTTSEENYVNQVSMSKNGSEYLVCERAMDSYAKRYRSTNPASGWTSAQTSYYIEEGSADHGILCSYVSPDGATIIYSGTQSATVENSLYPFGYRYEAPVEMYSAYGAEPYDRGIIFAEITGALQERVYMAKLSIDLFEPAKESFVMHDVYWVADSLCASYDYEKFVLSTWTYEREIGELWIGRRPRILMFNGVNFRDDVYTVHDELGILDLEYLDDQLK